MSGGTWAPTAPGPAVFHTHAAPLLGQHNHELLAELGLPADIDV
jgi:hypothetical protein